MLTRTFAALAVAFALVATGLAAGEATARSYIPALSAVHLDRGPVFREGCLIYTDAPTSPPCHYGDVGSDRKVVVFGDSHALQWTPALLGVAEERGWELTMLLRANCTAAMVNISPPCNRWRHNALERIEREKPGLVFIASSVAPNSYVTRDGQRLSRRASEPYLRRGMFNTLLRLRRTGAEVTLMRDLPASRTFVPPACVERNRDQPWRCSFRPWRPLSESYDFIAAKRFKRIQIIDPVPRICPRQRCRAVEGNIVIYRDRGHISATFVRTLTGWMGARLQDPFAASGN